VNTREYKNKLYPTWISVPLFAKMVNGLEVQLRVRGKKTSSVYSFESDGERRYDGEILYSGLPLLQRFLERGVRFLSRRKRGCSV
jgi:hypothetical protein